MLFKKRIMIFEKIDKLVFKLVKLEIKQKFIIRIFKSFGNARKKIRELNIRK